MSLDAVILLYAARYAFGRRSGAVQDVEQAIAANLDVFRADGGCREALIRELAAGCERMPAGCDRDSWLRTLGRLEETRSVDT